MEELTTTPEQTDRFRMEYFEEEKQCECFHRKLAAVNEIPCEQITLEWGNSESMDHTEKIEQAPTQIANDNHRVVDRQDHWFGLEYVIRHRNKLGEEASWEGRQSDPGMSLSFTQINRYRNLDVTVENALHL
jgi:hypothetical protein